MLLYFIIFWNRLMISAVFLPSRTATKMVLSPAMDPAISGHFRVSMASPATEALPEMVLMTIRFPALVMDRTLAGEDLDEPQLLYVSGHGGLGHLEALLAQELGQFLLGLHVPGSDDLDDHGMSFRLHTIRLIQKVYVSRS